MTRKKPSTAPKPAVQVGAAPEKPAIVVIKDGKSVEVRK